MKKTPVKAHTRKHPTKNKKVKVDSYERKQSFNPYKNINRITKNSLKCPKCSENSLVRSGFMKQPSEWKNGKPAWEFKEGDSMECLNCGAIIQITPKKLKKNPLNKQLINADWDILSTIREQINPTTYFFPRMEYYNEGSKEVTDGYKILDIQSNLGNIDVKQVKERIEHYRKLGIINKNEIKFTPSGLKNFNEWSSKLDYP